MEQRGERKARQTEEPQRGQSRPGLRQAQRGPIRAEMAARALLAGVAPEKLPPQSLTELAVQMGNSALEALLRAQAPLPELCPAQGLTAAAPDTAPFPAPGDAPVLADPQGLTEGAAAGRGFHPAQIQAGGGDLGPAL